MLDSSHLKTAISEANIPNLINLLITYDNDLTQLLSTKSNINGLCAGAGSKIVTQLLTNLPESLLRSSEIVEMSYQVIQSWINCVLYLFSSTTTAMNEDDDTTNLHLPSSILTTLALCLDPSTQLNKLTGHDTTTIEDDATLEWRRTLAFGEWIDAIFENNDGKKIWKEAQVVMEIPKENSTTNEVLLELKFKNEPDAKNVQRDRNDRDIAPKGTMLHNGTASSGKNNKKIPNDFYSSLKIGQHIDAIDQAGTWYNGTVLRKPGDEGKKDTVRITYRIYTPIGLYTDEKREDKAKFFGYRFECDEDHNLVKEEIQPLGYKANNIIKKMQAQDDYVAVEDSNDPVSIFYDGVESKQNDGKKRTIREKMRDKNTFVH